MTKAEEKAQRDNTNYINNSLRKRLLSFENDYLNGSVQYEFNSRKNRVNYFNNLIRDFDTREVTRSNRFETVANYVSRKEIIEAELALGAFITMNALNSAKASYDMKINKLVQKLVEEGFGYAHYKIEELKDAGSRFSFLISKEDKEVHARLIWVDGVEVAPHFRFITTIRKK